MLIPLLDLILHFNQELQHYPPEQLFTYEEVCSSTLAYLNLYRQTQEMLNTLGDQCNSILAQMKGD